MRPLLIVCCLLVLVPAARAIEPFPEDPALLAKIAALPEDGKTHTAFGLPAYKELVVVPQKTAHVRDTSPPPGEPEPELQAVAMGAIAWRTPDGETKRGVYLFLRDTMEDGPDAWQKRLLLSEKEARALLRTFPRVFSLHLGWNRRPDQGIGQPAVFRPAAGLTLEAYSAENAQRLLRRGILLGYGRHRVHLETPLSIAPFLEGLIAAWRALEPDARLF